MELGLYNGGRIFPMWWWGCGANQKTKLVGLLQLVLRKFGSFTSGAAVRFTSNVAIVIKPGNYKGDGVSSTIH